MLGQTLLHRRQTEVLVRRTQSLLARVDQHNCKSCLKLNRSGIGDLSTFEYIFQGMQLNYRFEFTNGDGPFRKHFSADELGRLMSDS